MSTTTHKSFKPHLIIWLGAQIGIRGIIIPGGVFLFLQFCEMSPQWNQILQLLFTHYHFKVALSISLLLLTSRCLTADTGQPKSLKICLGLCACTCVRSWTLLFFCHKFEQYTSVGKKGEYSKLAGKFYNVLFTCQSLHMYKILNQQLCGRHVLVISDTSGWLTSSFRDDAMLSHDKCNPQILALRCLMEENRHIWNAMSFCRQADSIM